MEKMEALWKITVSEWMRDAAMRFAGNRAITFRGTDWTYQEMDELTDQLAAAFLSLGIGRGKHAAVLAENSARYVFILYALFKAGAVACVINNSLAVSETQFMFRETDADVLFLGNHHKEQYFYNKFGSCLKEEKFERIFDIGEPVSSPYMSWEELIKKGKRQIEEDPLGFQKAKAAVRPEDPCLMIFTSGTSGSHPKAVVTSQFHQVNGGRLKAFGQGLMEKDVICCALQMFHIFCIDVNILAALAAGACLAIPAELRMQEVLKTIGTEHCTVLSAVPSIYQFLIKNPYFPSSCVDTLRTGVVGGAYCCPELFRGIEAAFGFTLLPGLGQTEITAGVAMCSTQDSLEIRSTTVGKAVPFAECEIRYVTDFKKVSQGQPGEICVKSPMIMNGYYKKPELTRQVVDEDGWLHTGDLGWFDEAGYLHLCGKLKDVINRGGEKILPNEVEEQLSLCRGVGECVVFGMPDCRYGEEVYAAVSGDGSAELSEKYLNDFLKNRIADCKIPRHYRFYRELPKTVTGKVSRKLLQKMIREEKN